MIVILADGQSNCGNQLNTAGLPESHDLTSQVHFWDTVDSVWRTCLEGSVIGSNPPRFSGSIPCALAQRIVNATGQDVYVMHNIRSGQPISHWVGNGELSVGFERLQNIAANALPAIERTTIDIHLWLQGESDWERSNEDYIADWLVYRTQLERQPWWFRPPTILMPLAAGVPTSFQNAALETIAETVPRVAIANGAGITASDGVHYRDSEQWAMGYQRMWPATKKRWSYQPSLGRGLAMAISH